MTTQAQQIGISPDGNLLVSIHPTTFEAFQKLLEYYYSNEEEKRKFELGDADNDEILTTEEFATLIKMSPDTVRKWCRIGKLQTAIVNPSARYKRLYKSKAFGLYESGALTKPQPQPELRPRFTERKAQ